MMPKADLGRSAFKAFRPTRGGWKSPLKKKKKVYGAELKGPGTIIVHIDPKVET